MLFLTCTLFGAVLTTSSQISKTAAVLTLNRYFCHKNLLLTPSWATFWVVLKSRWRVNQKALKKPGCCCCRVMGQWYLLHLRPSTPVVETRLVATILAPVKWTTEAACRYSAATGQHFAGISSHLLPISKAGHKPMNSIQYSYSHFTVSTHIWHKYRIGLNEGDQNPHSTFSCYYDGSCSPCLCWTVVKPQYWEDTGEFKVLLCQKKAKW